MEKTVPSIMHVNHTVNLFGETKPVNPQFGGCFFDEWGDFVYIKEVIYNAPVTVVLWSDGTKSMSRCSKDDTYNKELGLTIAVMKRTFGKEFLNMLFADWLSTDNVKKVSLVDVRKAHKNSK